MSFDNLRYGKAPSEAAEQSLLLNWVRFASVKYPVLDMLVHVPNEGKRSARAGSELKRQGLKAGYPDLALNAARCGYHGLFIEMKKRGGRATDAQIDWLECLEHEGNAVALCDCMESARNVLEAYARGDKQALDRLLLKAENDDFNLLRERKGRLK